jgi:hypothetical protein
MYAATTLKSYGPIPEKWDAQWRDWDDAVWVCNYVRPGAGSASGLISVAAGSRLGPASPLRLTPEINLAFSGEPAKTMR